MAFCNICGAKLVDDGQRFCQECGAPTNAPARPPVSSTPNYPTNFAQGDDPSALASGVYAGPSAYDRPNADCRLVYAGPPVDLPPVQTPPAQEMLMTYAGPPAPVYAGPQQMGGFGMGFMGMAVPAPAPSDEDGGTE